MLACLPAQPKGSEDEVGVAQLHLEAWATVVSDGLRCFVNIQTGDRATQFPRVGRYLSCLTARSETDPDPVRDEHTEIRHQDQASQIKLED